MKKFLKNSQIEPFRLFFPLGILCLLASVAVWLPQLWLQDSYPVTAHRTLVLNGFISFFIAGFLMTAVPKFSKTVHARKLEVILFPIFTFMTIIFSLFENIILINLFSTAQALVLIFFLISRISKRKENVPFSFVFIFIGLILWLTSGVLGSVFNSTAFINLHYEGAIASIILGVGTRLIPGIFGHIEIVSHQRKKYENAQSILSSIPTHFLFLVLSFTASYFFPENIGAPIRALVVSFIALKYWMLYKLPRTRSALTISLWINGWTITLSFLLKTLWQEGLIHASHSFFITGIMLICILIATRVLQAHGPGDIKLENSKYLYYITFLIIFAGITRVIAYIIESLYFRHLGYSSLLVIAGVLLWSIKYLKYVLIKNDSH